MKFLAILLLMAEQTVPEKSVVECQIPLVPAVVRLTKPERPAVPSCINEARNRHTCRDSVIAAYNARVEKYALDFNGYVAGMNGYVDALNRYMEEASRYTICERDAAGVVTGIIRG